METTSYAHSIDSEGKEEEEGRRLVRNDLAMRLQLVIVVEDLIMLSAISHSHGVLLHGELAMSTNGSKWTLRT